MGQFGPTRVVQKGAVSNKTWQCVFLKGLTFQYPTTSGRLAGLEIYI